MRHPKKSDGVLCAGISVKYAWIGRHKEQWPVTLQCDVLNVSASGYFEHQRRKRSDCPVKPNQHINDEALLVQAKAAVLGASVIAGIAGFIALRRAARATKAGAAQAFAGSLQG